jgi:hypothetical protein
VYSGSEGPRRVEPNITKIGQSVELAIVYMLSHVADHLQYDRAAEVRHARPKPGTAAYVEISDHQVLVDDMLI